MNNPFKNIDWDKFVGIFLIAVSMILIIKGQIIGFDYEPWSNLLYAALLITGCIKLSYKS